MGRPAASSPEALRRMQRQRRRDTRPELAVRRAVHALGLRFRVDRQVIPPVRRRADIVFPSAGVAVFVDGCFWHMCPEHRSLPRANAEWWAAKLARNVDRDRSTDDSLAAAGWLPLRVWEHEDPTTAAERIHEVVIARRHGSRPRRRSTS